MGKFTLFEQIRQCTDVVLVPMREHNPADLIRIALHKGEIRQHQVYAQHIVVWERHAAVDDQHIALTLVEGKVFPDLIQAAQKVNPDGRLLRSTVLPPLFSPRAAAFVSLLFWCCAFSGSAFFGARRIVRRFDGSAFAAGASAWMGCSGRCGSVTFP